MKVKRKKQKLIIILAIMSLLLVIGNYSYAYRIKHVVQTKEELYDKQEEIDKLTEAGKNIEDFPDMIYKKQVSAHPTTITAYTNAWKNMKENTKDYETIMTVAKDSWAYASENSTYLSSELVDPNGYIHEHTGSFKRIYEYFHKYQNSVYETETKGSNSTKYYSTGTLWPQTYVVATNQIQEVVYNVTSETNEYSGLFWKPSTPGDPAGTIANNPIDLELNMSTITGREDEPVVMLNSNVYRFAVTVPGNNEENNNGIYISDNIIDNDTIQNLWDKFGESNNHKELTVYGSSVLRTNENNAKGEEKFYKHMDTAYKFWECTISGSSAVKDAWKWSSSITGIRSDSPQGASSAINYYDNTYVFPKGNAITVYVRHIDVTGLDENFTLADIDNSRVITGINNSQIFKIKNTVTTPYYFENYVWPIGEREQVVGTMKYNEKYELNLDDSDWVVANMKYNNSDDYWLSETELISVKALNDLDGAVYTEKENDILENYNCVGKLYRQGDSVEIAISKNNTIDKTGGDFTNYRVDGDTEAGNYIIIDFYYEKKDDDSDGGLGGGQDKSKKHVYVRHIDISGVAEDDITSSNMDQLAKRQTDLLGTGIARIVGSTATKAKEQSVDIGYQELYVMSSGQELIISRDENVNYNCVGSNIVASKISLEDAKDKMDDRIDDSKYSTTYTSTRQTDEVNGGDNYITIIDFYYRSKYSGNLIDRPTKGRLSFYTLNSNPLRISGDSSDDNNINYHTTDDGEEVIDVVPSGESLKVSIDNAYKYMLGAINIKEQKITGEYEITYTITQPYTVNYIHWTSSCSNSHNCGGESEGIDERTSCGLTYTVPDTCTDDEGEEYDCDKEVTCTGSWTAYAGKASIQGELERTYTLCTIPYEYTFYKVKNMRLYTISKIELHDNYSNNGLPLFDGQTHTVLPKNDYTNSFNSTNTEFIGSSSSQTMQNDSRELTRIVFYHNNTEGNVTEDEASATAVSTLNDMLDKVEALDAAEISGFKVTGNSYKSNPSKDGASEATNYQYNGINTSSYENRVKAKFSVTNDQAYFTDIVNNSTDTYIVGKDTSKSTTKAKTSEDSSYKSEQKAEKIIDVIEYFNKKDGTINVSTVYPKSVRGSTENAKGSQYLPTSALTTQDYYNNDSFTIPENRLNGKRYSYGKIYYNLISGNNELNFDATDSGVVTCDESNKTNCHDWNDSRTAVTGSAGNSFIDTEMYNTSGSKNPTTTTLISPGSLSEIVWEYGKNNNKNTSNDADIVDVFTPIAFRTWIVTGHESGNPQVNHSNEDISTNETILQKNTRFTIAMEPTKENIEYDDENLDTDPYLMQYYIKFDFDVQDIKITDAKGKNRNYDVGAVEAGEWIGPIYNDTKKDDRAEISAFALADPNETISGSVVNQMTNSYTVRAVAYNAPSSLIYDLVRNKLSKEILNEKYEWFVTQKYNKYDGVNNTDKSHEKYYEQTNIEGHNNYVAEITVETENISRVYDFKVTDLKDLDWKDIFRKSSTTTTNAHTSEAYYSGVKKWNIYTTATNQLLTRDASEIGATKQQILPLGPYKNTNTTYVKAPKLGYKFSFDLKTTGAMDTDSDDNLLVNKKVVIKPKFYYISKYEDGNTGNPVKIDDDKLKLFYKNSNNKYVDIKNYNLYFVPDDGYRLTFEGTDAAYRFSSSSLSKATVKLGTAKEITLTEKMMEKADNMFVQIWYGEYKLPNSTIAVKVDSNGKYDINKPLKDGYIGVRFDIEVIEYKDSKMTDEKRRIYYNRQDENADGTNTTQWDYEGYLGYDYYKKDGAIVEQTDNIRIALEDMTWVLDQDDYEFVRGTVILYDTDAKASNDYD